MMGSDHMPELHIVDADGLDAVAGYAAPFTQLASGSATSRICAPDEFGLFSLHAELASGTVLQWAPHHGDEGVYVAEGTVVVDGEAIDPGGAVVIEADVPTRLEAATDVKVVHVGTTQAGPVTNSTVGSPESDGHRNHVCHADTAPRRSFELAPLEFEGKLYEDVVHTSWFGDATCPRCRIVLFRTWGPGPHRSGINHSHSVHELIIVTSGEIRFDGQPLKAGTTLAIPADLRYTFDTAMEWEFLNYRPDASYVTRNPAEPPIFDQV
jgi:quercetin dioxygenase-like cupin family protein